MCEYVANQILIQTQPRQSTHTHTPLHSRVHTSAHVMIQSVDTVYHLVWSELVIEVVLCEEGVVCA